MHHPNRRPGFHRALLALCCIAVLGASTVGEARASCATIPSAEGDFASVQGSVSAPFAKPGDVVVVRRELPAFAADPAGNRIIVRFLAPDRTFREVAATALPPLAGSDCAPETCVANRCPCIRIEFPDTDALLGAADDGVTLAGPAAILVSTDQRLTALIDGLSRSGPNAGDALFPGFVALPPATRFASLVDAPGSPVLAAPTHDGNLLLPLTYAELVDAGLTQTRFIEAVVPALASAPDVRIDSLTSRGAILPPLLRPVAGGGIVATIDAPASVLAISGLPPTMQLERLGDGGPVRLGGIVAAADPRKRAEPTTLESHARFAVFETRECGPFDVPELCADLNGDGDQSDFFLQALDVAQIGSDPLRVDSIDGRDFAGFPGEFPPALYAFRASDALVQFRIPEPPDPLSDSGDAFDVDGDGVPGEVVRKGAFDLLRDEPVPFADRSSRRSIADALLAFSVTAGSGRPVLGLYDAHAASPGPIVPFALPIALSPSYQQLLGATLYEPYERDVVAGDGFAAIVVDEAALNQDLNLDGVRTQALVVVETSGGTPTRAYSLPGAPIEKIQAAGKVLAYEVIRTDLQHGPREIVVYDVATGSLVLIPGPEGADRFIAGPMSSEVIPYARVEEDSADGAPEDLNGDGDTEDSVLHAFVRPATGDPFDVDLGLALPNVGSFAGGGGYAIANGSVLLFPVGELEQGGDLDGDGVIGPPPPEAGPGARATLHTYDARSGRTLNFGVRALVLRPLVRFVDHGLALITATSPIDLTRRFLRDLDGDLAFEEIALDARTGETVFGDNCPRVFNPEQSDTDGDGIGDACEHVDACAAACARPDAIVGTSGADRLVGTTGEDVLCGAGGDDWLDGRGGNDVLCGGEGDDVLHGGEGDDVLEGDAGADRLAGGAGDDTLLGGPGNDRIFGNAGSDALEGGSGDDHLAGRAGDDRILGGDGDDVVNGDGGNDEVDGEDGADHLRGGPGIDIVVGGRGNDRLSGGIGDDLLDARDGGDRVAPGAGTDTCLGAAPVPACEWS